jgi:hypothetical protein
MCVCLCVCVCGGDDLCGAESMGQEMSVQRLPWFLPRLWLGRVAARTPDENAKGSGIKHCQAFVTNLARDAGSAS